MNFLRMMGFAIGGCAIAACTACTIVNPGAILSRPSEIKPEPRSTSISPNGKYVVSVVAHPMLFGMPGQGSDASGEMILMDAAGNELNRKSIEMVQLASVNWGGDRVKVGATQDTWTLPAIDNPSILLFSAAYTGKEAEFNRLLDQGADIHFTTTLGQTLLHAAVVGQNPAITQQVLQKKVAINAIDQTGQTALHLAASRNSVIAQRLIDQGADLNIADRRGRTPLAIAAANGNRSNVKLLLERGANVSRTSGNIGAYSGTVSIVVTSAI